MPPHFVAEGAKTDNSLIAEGCTVAGSLDFSVLFAGVEVEAGAEVSYSILMPGAKIKKGAKVSYAIVAEDAVIGEGAVVGAPPQDAPDPDEWGVAVVGRDVTVGKNAVVAPKEMIAENRNAKGGENA